MKKKNTKSVKKPVKAKVVETKVDAVVKTNVSTNVSKDISVERKAFAINSVKVISVLGLIGSTVFMLSGLIFLFFKEMVLDQIRQLPPVAGYESITSSGVGWMGAVMILFGAVWFVVSMNLWQFRKWARIVAIVLAAVGTLSALMSFPAGWFGFLLHGTVLYFLALHPDVKKLFE